MANKIYNFTDLIQRVTASCLLSPLVLTHDSANQPTKPIEYTPTAQEDEEDEDTQGSEEECEQTPNSGSEEGLRKREGLKKQMESEALMAEMFDAVSDLKRAYVSLQEAHCPWDPVKMSVADAAVVKELKRMGRLKERFRRMGGSRGGGLGSVASLREAVAPYEETVEELKREVKAKEAEVENLQEKLKSVSVSQVGGKKGRFHSKRKLSCSQPHAAPVPELFVTTMSQVKEASKSLTSLLLSLMRSARWDIAATVQSIESGRNTSNDDEEITRSTVGSHYAKFALESYISSKFFSGFDHETFYMDGSLSSLLNPEQYRRDCFTQFRDMNSMDPTELLGILPSCPFGQFCCKKYLSMISPEMEESLFGDLEQNRLISGGNHPRTTFYGQFLKAAKAVWLLHLLAFSLDPSPTLFLASKGAEFQPEYMESVVRVSGKSMPASQIVGIPVSPGFKLGSGSIIKARVHLVPKK